VLAGALGETGCEGSAQRASLILDGAYAAGVARSDYEESVGGIGVDEMEEMGGKSLG
jgi:hypothetical protein